MKNLISGLVVGTVMSASVMAADPSIDARDKAMKGVKDNAVAMLDIVKGEKPDTGFQAYADGLVVAAKASKTAFAVKAPGGKTLPATWENWDDFAAKMDKFIADTEALQAVGSADMKTRQGAVFNTFKNCKACHDTYKKDDD